MKSSSSLRVELDPEIAAPALSDLRMATCLWRPWYAKAWWIAMPLYWLPAGLASGPVVPSFYSSAVGVITNLTFLPLTAGLVLGFGCLRRMLADYAPAEPWFDHDIGAYRRPGMSHPAMDQTNPRSGAQWVGLACHMDGPS